MTVLGRNQSTHRNSSIIHRRVILPGNISVVRFRLLPVSSINATAGRVPPGILVEVTLRYFSVCWPSNSSPLPFGAQIELELELIQTQMTQKPMLRAEVYARALRASQNRKEDSVKSSYVLTSESGGRATHKKSKPQINVLTPSS
jgi:hypothetical protein